MSTAGRIRAQAGSSTGTAKSTKVAFSPEKQDWHPSVLPGLIVLVSTVDEQGEPNIAPKSWVSMAAFNGPVLTFGCDRSHATARNTEAVGEFVVNVPPEALVERIVSVFLWAAPREVLDDRGNTLPVDFGPTAQPGNEAASKHRGPNGLFAKGAEPTRPPRFCEQVGLRTQINTDSHCEELATCGVSKFARSVWVANGCHTDGFRPF